MVSQLASDAPEEAAEDEAEEGEEPAVSGSSLLQPTTGTRLTPASSRIILRR
jgi:hypothetical protein